MIIKINKTVDKDNNVIVQHGNEAGKTNKRPHSVLDLSIVEIF